MYLVFLNPQGNFDKFDSYWTEHPDFGGQLVYVKEIAIALARLGHRVDIITRQFSDDVLQGFDQTFDAYENEPNVRIVRIPCGPKEFLQKERLWEHLDSWTEHIVQFFETEHMTPDFITGHYGDGGLAAALLKQKLQIPFSFTGHSLGAQKLEKLGVSKANIQALETKYQFSKRIEAERISMKYANLIFVSTKQERDEQYRHILYRDITTNIQDRFRVAPPGANTEVFHDSPSKEDEQYTKKFDQITTRDISKDRRSLPYVVLASRLDPKKNHLGLLKAYAKDKALQKRCNLAISLRGIDNAYHDYSFAKPDELKILDEMMSLIRTYQLHGHITFISINSQKELAAFYRYMASKQSLFSLTALYEPFGLAPIEAMSAGLPAVVTKYGGPSDVLQENNIAYGVLIDVFDETSIAKGLHEGFDHYLNYKKLGKKRVLESYTWEATAKRYLQAIQDILDQTLIKETMDIHPYFKGVLSNKIGIEFIKKHIKEMEKSNE